MSVPAAFLGVVLIWSTTPLAIQWSSEGWGFLFGVTGRMLLGMLFCFLLLTLLGNRLPWNKQARATYMVASISIYGAMMSVYWGAQYIDSGLIAVVFALSPIVTAFMASIWLQENSMTAGKLLGGVLGLAGLWLIFVSDVSGAHFAWQGIAAILLAVLLHSASAVWIKRIAAPLSGLTVTSGGLLLGAPMYLITWALLGDHDFSEFSLRASISMVYLGVVGSVLGFTLYFYILKNMEANKVALITLMTPVLALVIGQGVNGEIISNDVWLGTAVILLGLFTHQWGDQWLRVPIRRHK